MEKRQPVLLYIAAFYTGINWHKLVYAGINCHKLVFATDCQKLGLCRHFANPAFDVYC